MKRPAQFKKMLLLGSVLTIAIMLFAFSFSFLELSASFRQHSEAVEAESERLHAIDDLLATTRQRSADFRGYLLTGDRSFVESVLLARSSFSDQLADLESAPNRPQVEKDLIQSIKAQDQDFRPIVDRVRRQKDAGADTESLLQVMEAEILPARQELENTILRFRDTVKASYDQSKQVARDDLPRTKRAIMLFIVLATLAAAAVAFAISQVLSRIYRELQQTMAQTAAAKNLVDAIVTTSADGLIAVDENDRVFAFNPAAEKLFRKKAAEVLGKKYGELKLLPSPFDETYSIRQTAVRSECELSLQDGTKLSIEISHSIPINGSTQLTAIFVRDVSEVKKAREALLESEQVYRLSVKAASDLIWDWDLKKNQIWYGEAITDLLGVPREEVGKGIEWWLGLVHPEDRERVRKSLQEAIEHGEDFWGAEYRMIHEDGSYRDVIDRAYLLKRAGIPYRMVGSTLDLTVIRKREHELARAVRARDELVGIISHELKNPITAMATGIELIDRTLPKVPGIEAVRKGLRKLKPSLIRMSRLISDLLDITRLEAGVLRIEPGVSAPAGIVEEVVSSYAAAAKQKSIELALNVPVELPNVYCDTERAGQIIANLVGNAIKYTPVGGRIEVSASHVRDDIVFRVKDTGPGIAPENRQRVFDRFWQSKEVRHRGTGLGLAIAKGLVEAQGGRIWVEGEVGKGAIFCFTLPTHQAITRKMPAA